MNEVPPDALMIWGHRLCAPTQEARILWSQQGTTSAQISLPDVIHSNRLHWKSEYARWLGGVGKSYSASDPAQEFREHHDGFSYWWMTFPTEFTFSNDCVAYKVLRLMALVDSIKAMGPRRILMSGLSADVSTCIAVWCSQEGIEFESLAGPPACGCDSNDSLAPGSHSAGLRYLWSQFARYGFRSARPKAADRLIIDYFDNVQRYSDTYKSQYWGELAEILNSLPGTTRWSHIDVRSAALPKATMARNHAENLTRAGASTHDLVQDSITLGVLRKSLSTLNRIERIGRDSWPNVSFIDDARRIDFRPVVMNSWRRHHGGVTGAVNALNLHLMRKLVAGVNGPALYLMENQPWEMALLHAWRRQSGHRISGWVHSRARAWDLRYALPLLKDSDDAANNPPSPDACLVGSANEAQVLKEDGYQSEQILEVEAVRFTANIPAADTEARPTDARRILVLGEYDDTSNALLMDSLLRSELDGFTITYRPHPSRQVTGDRLPAHIHVAHEESLAHALSKCDVVLSMSTSTSVITAVQFRLPVIVLQDSNVLDGSEFRGNSVTRIPMSTLIDRELILGAQKNALSGEWSICEQHREPDLPRWRSWLHSWS